jgi:hypothetical protein
MQITISDEHALQISLLATHLENMDGTPRSIDDIIEFMLGGLASVRPDIATVIYGGN